MESYHDIQYHLQQGVGDQTPSTSGAATRSSMRLSSGTVSEPDTSFDSGFLSPTKSAHFTAISSNPRASGHPLHSPAKMAGSSTVAELPGRSVWAEDTGVSDEWDRHFIDNFQENLFGFDAADLNNMVDGILRSPFKSPQSSPFKSPRQGRSVGAGLGFSPFKSVSTSNIMLTGPKRSPLRFGGSPFKSPFSSPSPGKSGMNLYTRSSPLTRQRRLILQSPVHKPATVSVTSDPFAELPEFLTDIKEEVAEDDDLGVVPFQRSSSFGFIPQEDSPSAFTESFSALTSFTDAEQPFQQPNFLEIQLENGLTQMRSKKIGRRESPRKHATLGGVSTTPGKSSITKHSQVITTLHSKDALRLVRARFREILDRATEDAIQKEKTAMKRTPRKPQYPEIANALSKPGPKGHSTMQDFGLGQVQKGGKRRLEIRPKPDPNWQRSEPVRIAPKKRKR